MKNHFFILGLGLLLAPLSISNLSASNAKLEVEVEIEKTELPKTYQELRKNFVNWQSNHINDQIHQYVNAHAKEIDRPTLMKIMRDLRSGWNIFRRNSLNLENPKDKNDRNRMRQINTRGTILRDWEKANGVKRAIPYAWPVRALGTVGLVSSTAPYIMDKLTVKMAEINSMPSSQQAYLAAVSVISVAAAIEGIRSIKNGLPQSRWSLTKATAAGFLTAAGATVKGTVLAAGLTIASHECASLLQKVGLF